MEGRRDRACRRAGPGHADCRLQGDRSRLLPRPLNGFRSGLSEARPSGGGTHTPCGRAGGRAAHHLSRWPAARESRLGASRLPSRDRRRAARGSCTGDRGSRRHRRGAGLRRLRGHPRSRLPPAGDGDPALGTLPHTANRPRRPDRVPPAPPGNGSAGKSPIRCRRPRGRPLSGPAHPLRTRDQQAGVHHPDSCPHPTPFLVLAGFGDRRPFKYRPTAHRRSEA